MPIHQAIKADWRTPELLIEGSLNCAKTTVWLDKELDALLKWPGIKSLLFRWSQDACDTKLQPAFEELMDIRGITAAWDPKKKRFTFENGSIAYMFGLKSVSLVELMNKIRGLGVSRASGDQVEEVDQRVAGELRGRLRPDLRETTVNKQRFPFQLIFVSNSEDDDFWLSKEFPVDNRIKGRRVHQLSIFDNKHLPQESIDSLLRQYPEDHPKHRTMILGRRGPKVYGVPVFEGLYRKDLHWRAATVRADAPILESFIYGQHNPVWVFGQALYGGGFCVLGGIFALGMVLEDFWRAVKPYRDAWIPDSMTVKSCVPPMGRDHSLRDVLVRIAKINPRYDDDGNSPITRLKMIENLSGYLRGRNATGGESFAVNNDEAKFIIINKEGERLSPFVHHAFEGGATWDDHSVSVAHADARHTREDDKFANILHAIENIELNFLAGRKSQADRDEAAKAHPPVHRPQVISQWG